MQGSRRFQKRDTEVRNVCWHLSVTICCTTNGNLDLRRGKEKNNWKLKVTTKSKEEEVIKPNDTSVQLRVARGTNKDTVPMMESDFVWIDNFV